MVSPNLGIRNRALVKCLLLSIGKTQDAWLKQGMDVYLRRLPHYLPFQYLELPPVKNATKLPQATLKEAEGKAILAQTEPGDSIYLLDEKGKTFTSRQFAGFFEKQNIQGTRRLVFVIGGAYGFSEEVYKAANGKIALSAMTFSHQMVRVITLEQIYRAQSILRGEPYHHD